MKNVAKVLAHYLDIQVSDIKLESKLRDLAADSLDQIEIILALEDEFEIDIDDDDINQLITVKDIVEYVGDHDEENAQESETEPVIENTTDSSSLIINEEAITER